MNGFQKNAVACCLGIMVMTALLSVVLTGCAGYRLGSTLPEGINVINVPTFVNKTTEPLLDVIATQATIKEIQRDGTLSIGTLDKSDIVLHVSLIGIKLQPLLYEKDSRTTTREYRMTLTASLKLTNLSTGKVMTRNVVIGETDFMPTGDLSTAKREAIPFAAKDLARRIVENVVEYW